MSDSWGFWGAFGSVALATILLTAGPGRADDPVATTIERFSYQQVAKAAPADESRPQDVGYHEYKMVQERNRFWALVLLAGTAVTGHLLLLWRLGGDSPAQVVTGTGFIYLVFGTVVLVTLSDNKDQLTASMGIMGAIAGYLFGRTGQPARPGGASGLDSAARGEPR